MSYDDLFEISGEIFGESEILADNEKFHENQTFHDQQKQKRRISRNKQRARKVRRINTLSDCGGGMTVWLDGHLDDVTGSFVPSGKLKRSKNSNTQRYLKRASTRKIRRIPATEKPADGGHYRKHFDYWWNLT